MQFGLTESQQILKNSARQFFAAECPMAEVRRIMETDTAYDAKLWTAIAGQGYTGIIFPEEYGGLGLGKVELALLMEEMGRALVPGPYFSTIAAGAMLDACGSEDQKQRYLSGICSGQTRATLVQAKDAARTFAPGAPKSVSTLGLFVPDAATADYLIVSTPEAACIVGRNAPGLTIEPMRGMDLTRRIYAVHLNDSPCEPLANPECRNEAIHVATMALCAELAGGMQRVLDIAVEYAKTRKQFGQPIGQFQAVQHQLADCYLETESARSAAYYAAWALQEGTPDASTAVSIAKVYASDAARNVGNRGIQVHGGMGFTWENDIHLYYRRFKAGETAYGDATYHRERIAKLVIDRSAAATA